MKEIQEELMTANTLSNITILPLISITCLEKVQHSNKCCYISQSNFETTYAFSEYLNIDHFLCS